MTKTLYDIQVARVPSSIVEPRISVHFKPNCRATPRKETNCTQSLSLSLSLSLLLVLSVRSLSFEFHWLTRSISASLRRTDQKRGSRRRSANSFGQDCLPKNWNLHEESVYTVQLLKPRSSLSCRIDVFLL